MSHPCQKCGACCASFRVEFYWREGNTADTEHAVPEEMWIDLTSQVRAMKGTEKKHQPKCIALTGRIGENVSCSIYENRSSTCRRFQASFENGKRSPQCDVAREKHGLEPLRREDWLPFIEGAAKLIQVHRQGQTHELVPQKKS